VELSGVGAAEAIDPRRSTVDKEQIADNMMDWVKTVLQIALESV
jgi:hypothetical protein